MPSYYNEWNKEFKTKDMTGHRYGAGEGLL